MIFFWNLLCAVWCREAKYGYPNRDLLYRKTGFVAFDCDYLGSTWTWNSTMCYKLFQWLLITSFLLRGMHFAQIFLNNWIVKTTVFNCFDSRLVYIRNWSKEHKWPLKRSSKNSSEMQVMEEVACRTLEYNKYNKEKFVFWKICRLFILDLSFCSFNM